MKTNNTNNNNNNEKLTVASKSNTINFGATDIVFKIEDNIKFYFFLKIVNSFLKKCVNKNVFV